MKFFYIIILSFKMLSWSEFVAKGCYDKVLNAGWLKQQNFAVSQFWRLEVSSQDLGRAVLSLTPLGEILAGLSEILVFSSDLHYSWLTDASLQSRGCLLAVCSYHFTCSVCLCIQISPFIKTPAIADDNSF